MKKHQTRTANNRLFAATHGESRTKLYKVWAAMKDRCSNPASTTYKRYGGRGIKVCKQWQDSYKSFRDWAINTDDDGEERDTLLILQKPKGF